MGVFKNFFYNAKLFFYKFFEKFERKNVEFLITKAENWEFFFWRGLIFMKVLRAGAIYSKISSFF